MLEHCHILASCFTLSVIKSHKILEKIKSESEIAFRNHKKKE